MSTHTDFCWKYNVTNIVLIITSLQCSVLEVPDNWSRSEPRVEDVVHCFLDLFTDYQVITLFRVNFVEFSITASVLPKFELQTSPERMC